MSKENQARVFFTSDHHFGHERAIAMNRRPFPDVEMMTTVMIAVWNSCIHPGDVVYHLGDFAYRSAPGQATSVFHRLNGEKHLITGNHDGPETLALPWSSVSQMREVVVDSQRIFMCHYPMLEWPGYHRDVVHLFGHVHGNTEGVGASVDVGVDSWDFRPVSLASIRIRLKQKGVIR